jgi:hypothetical protein
MNPAYIIGGIAGVASALLLLTAALGSVAGMLLLYLAPLPVFLAGLGWGLVAAAIAAAVGTVLMSLFTQFAGGFVYFALIAAAPLWLVRQALLSRPAPAADGASPSLEWYPSGNLLAWTAALGCALFLATFILLSGTEGGMRGAVERTVAGMAEMLEPVFLRLEEGGDGTMVREDILELLTALVVPMAGILWVLMMVLNGALAQGLLERSGRAWRPPFEVSGTALPNVLLLALGGALLLAFAPGDIGFAGAVMAAILAVPFFLTGLVTVHVVSRVLADRAGDMGRAARVGFLVLMYALLLLQGIWAIAIFILGLIDQWIGLRRRALGNAGPHRENE